MGQGDRDTERQRQIPREGGRRQGARETTSHNEADRQRDKETEKQVDSETARQRDRETVRRIYRETEKNGPSSVSIAACLSLVPIRNGFI